MYPALTVLAHLKGDLSPKGIDKDFDDRRLSDEPSEVDPRKQNEERQALTTLWVGGIGGMEVDLVQREGISFQAIPAAGVVGVGRALPKNLLQLSRGYAASRRILRQYRPDVLFFTGGFLAVPMAFAARTPGLPFRRPRNLLYVPDIEPGLALKSLTRLADGIAVSTEESRKYFPTSSRVVVTGYPVRPDLQAWAKKSREEARRVFGLDDDLPVLLVTGGSRGAQSINRALMSALPKLLESVQVLHVTGTLDWQMVNSTWESQATRLPSEQAGRYRAYPYLHDEMGAALAAADLVLSRAGASTLGEYPLFGLPAVLVPYPYTWRYQQVNALYLQRHGAARILQDENLSTELLPLVRDLLADHAGLQAMSAAMRSLARPNAGAEIGNLLVELAQEPERENYG